jgi:hypothetical protein
MKEVFLILGYGVPKNMRTDLNYQIYVRSIFNSIYQQVVDRGIQPTIVASGGPTDLFKPYRRTEAGEMVKELERMRQMLPRRVGAGWRIVAEPRSFSLLENILFTRRRLGSLRAVTIFCEVTRVRRVKATAKKIFGGRTRIIVRGIDFDASSTRYLDPKLLRRKERVNIHFDDWALKSPANLRRHHDIHVDKVRRFRQADSPDSLRSVRQWFEESTKNFPAIQKSRKK